MSDELWQPGFGPDDPEQLPPDYVGVFVGWRAWGVVPSSLPILRSPSGGGAVQWPHGKVMIAACRKDHLAPTKSCACGIYAATTLPHLQSMGYHTYRPELGFKIVGECNLWGTVVEGTQGWRAEKAYPKALYVPFEAWKLAEPLADAYRVPVKLVNTLRARQPEEAL